MNWLINIYIIKVQMLVKRILSNLENTNLFNFSLKEKNPEQSPKGYSEHWIEKEQKTHWAKVKEKRNDLQNTTQKTKTRATLTSQSNLRCSEVILTFRENTLHEVWIIRIKEQVGEKGRQLVPLWYLFF
jgi:hypothetical protein